MLLALIEENPTIKDQPIDIIMYTVYFNCLFELLHDLVVMFECNVEGRGVK